MDRLYQLAATFPAGTPVNAPISVPLILEDNQLVEMDITIPDGPSGLMGFRVLQSQQQIVPWGNTGFIVANDEKIRYSYDDQIQSSGIVVQGYNTDIFAHTIYIRVTITDLPLPGTDAEADIVGDQSGSDIGQGSVDEMSVSSILGPQGDDTGIPPPVTMPIVLKTSPVQEKTPKTKDHEIKPVKAEPVKVVKHGTSRLAGHH